MYDDDLTDDDDQQGPKGLRKHAKELEAKLAAAEAKAAQADLLAKKVAMAEAGIDLSKPMAKYFVNGYDGELSADAIKAAATEAGVLGSPAPPVADPRIVEEARTIENVANAATGAPIGDMRNDEYEAKLAQTQTVEQALAVMREYGVHITLDNPD